MENLTKTEQGRFSCSVQNRPQEGTLLRLAREPSLAEKIKEWAKEIGFYSVGILPGEALTSALVPYRQVKHSLHG